MPLIIPNQLPAAETLQSENIFTMERGRASTQEIRPLKIVIVNLMPTKIATETQLAILEEKRNDKKFNFNYLPNFLSEDAKSKLAEIAVADKDSISENKIFKGLVEGRVSKQLKDICLLDQTYVRAEDGKQTVSQYLATVNKDLSLVAVVRFEVGEGIEKKEEDFAAEVAAQQAAAAKK